MRKRLKYFAIISDQQEYPNWEKFYLLHPNSTNKKDAEMEAKGIALTVCVQHNIPKCFIMLGKCEFVKNINYSRQTSKAEVKKSIGKKLLNRAR